MQVKNISVEVSFTYSLGNYSSCKPSFSVVAELQEGDNYEDEMALLRAALMRQIDSALMDAKALQRGQDDVAF